MISRKDFKDLIDSCQKITEFFENANKAGISIKDEVRDNIGHIEYLIIKENFGENGYDWFNWWMYELPSVRKKEVKEYYASEADGTPIILDTPDQLYDFLLQNNFETDGEDKSNS